MLGACAWAPAAFASGGASIASAPTVVYGQQEFGNTLTDNPATNCNHPPYGTSWWLLPVIAGDHITINYQGQDDEMQQDLSPVGTTDFAVGAQNVYPVESTSPGPNDAGQGLYTAPRDGVMPVNFLDEGCDATAPGPFNFTVYDQHQLVLSLRSSPNARRHLTTFRLTIRNPDGVTVSPQSLRATVQRLIGRKWVTNATVSPAFFSFTENWNHAQRGQWQSVRVQMSGPSYLTATSSVRVRGV